MHFQKRTSSFIATAFAAVMFAAGFGNQAALAQQPSVLAASPATISQVVAATTFQQTNVFIAVCDKQSPDCQEYLQGFALSASLVKGGWTGGVQNMRSSEFYSLDATPANASALSKSCSVSGQSIVVKTACQALTSAMTASGKQGVHLVMINRKTGAVQTSLGLTDQMTLSRAIVSFLKK